MNQPYFLRRLDVDADADERSIRRAYARELKKIDQEADPAGFQSLREAYDAALFWLQHRAHEHENDQPEMTMAAEGVAEADLVDSNGSEPRAHYAGAHEAEYHNQPGEASQEEMARAVFSEFLSRCALIGNEFGVTDDAPWQRELRSSLADARLVNIAAREIFEWHVASLLADGWEPGNEALLVAATSVFGWGLDRRRILGFGQAGAILDRAIEQRAAFDMQPDQERQRQRRLIERLRDPALPGTAEVLKNSARLELMVARFPGWLPLITSVPNITQWRELDANLPAWRRKLASIGRRKPAQAAKPKSRINWGWLIFVVIWTLIKFASHNVDSPSSSPPSSPFPPLQTQTDAARLVKQGNEQLGSNNIAGAIARYDEAIAKNPNYSAAYAHRAMAHLTDNENAAARADIDKALALDRSNVLAYVGRGVLAQEQKDYPEALAAFTRSLQLSPKNAYVYFQRAQTYEEYGEAKMALADTDAVIRLNPQFDAELYQLRARIFIEQNKKDLAAAEAEAVVAAMPAVPDAYKVAAYVYAKLERRKDALAILERGFAALPTSADLSAYHEQLLPVSDFAGRRRDLDRAIALKPHDAHILLQRANLELNARRFPAAVTAFTAALQDSGGDRSRKSRVLVGRGIALTMSGKATEADADFKAAQEMAQTSSDFNNICWSMAVNNVALQSALLSCDAALTKNAESAPALDSKGFVLLRLKRYRESIAAYDAAVKVRPDQASSLYGRAIAKRRSGDVQGGESDLKAARKIGTGIDRQYAEYGVVP